MASNGKVKNKKIVIPERALEVGLMCRDFGHAWKVDGPLVVDGYVVTRNLRCRNCDSTRVEQMSRRTGELYGRRYTYITGYQVPGGGIRKDQWRRIHVEQEIGEQK